MKKIGFIDYYISEWHANNYPAWIKEFCEGAGLEYEISYAWAAKDVSEVDGVTTAEWCEKFGVTQCESAKELCEKSDYIIILSPSNPEQHLALAEASFPYAKGKRIYIDKTFAPDLETAKKIFALAKEYDIKFFSTSALRYSNEIDTARNCEKVVTRGTGKKMHEYIIHQIEMVIKTMGTDVLGVKTVKNDAETACYVEYKDGRKAEMYHHSDYPFAITLTKDGVEEGGQIASPFFKNLIGKIITFFENGEVDFDEKETLAVMALREAVVKSSESDGAFIKCPEIL